MDGKNSQKNLLACALLRAALQIFRKILRLSKESLELYFLFFFQAEDGIRDAVVTGVQTCALPISRLASAAVVAQFGVDRALQVNISLADGGLHRLPCALFAQLGKLPMEVEGDGGPGKPARYARDRKSVV